MRIVNIIPALHQYVSIVILSRDYNVVPKYSLTEHGCGLLVLYFNKVDYCFFITLIHIRKTLKCLSANKFKFWNVTVGNNY